MKVGIDQRNKPAPLWFRRLRDASVNFLLPALGQLVTSLNLTDAKENMWLQVLTFLPAAFNFVGVLLGEDVKRKIRVWVLVLGAASLLTACRTPAQIVADKARAQVIKDSIAREARMQTLQQVRKELPCHPIKLVQGITRYLPGDSIPCPDNGKCPPKQVRVDTVYYEDMAALKAVRDSLDKALYIQGLKDAHILSLQASYDKQLKRAEEQEAKADAWFRRFWWGVGIIIVVVIAFLGLKTKFSFILKPIRWLVSILR
ncbi:hypothetical protein [Chitinophaga sp.]|uniref:hypothetical protein n=1 Tax=Chitinophaga sp. TaxID=1869181 RepID=UPI0031DC171B